VNGKWFLGGDDDGIFLEKSIKFVGCMLVYVAYLQEGLNIGIVWLYKGCSWNGIQR